MLTLYQAEWCPHSHRVRRRLTELGLDFVARQVPARREERDVMRAATGFDSIPVLVFDDGAVVKGDDAILGELDQRYGERPDVDEHRRKELDEVEVWHRLLGELTGGE